MSLRGRLLLLALQSPGRHEENAAPAEAGMNCSNFASYWRRERDEPTLIILPVPSAISIPALMGNTVGLAVKLRAGASVLASGSEPSPAHFNMDGEPAVLRYLSSEHASALARTAGRLPQRF